MIEVVYLDMDGVICDFMGQLHKTLGVEYDTSKYPYEATKYDIFEDLCARGGISMDNLYRACDPAEFWSEMPWDPRGKEIFDSIKWVLGKDWPNRVCICTSPMPTPDAWKGKIAWLRHHIPEMKQIIMTSAPKHYLAKPGRILVDDKDSNVEKFRAHGGDAFLVPQPWNNGRDKFNTEYTTDLRVFLRNREDGRSPLATLWKAFGC